MQEDQELIQKAREGDSEAFRELLERYGRKVYYLALDLTGSPQDAEDLSQDVFMKVCQSLHTFRGEASFGSWLYRITVNTNINHYRRKAFQALKTVETMDDQIWNQHHTSTNHNPEKNAESSIMQQHIHKALDGLTPREHSIFVMRHYQDMPLKEIAEALQIRVGTVKSTLFRALQRMQKTLSFYRVTA